MPSTKVLTQFLIGIALAVVAYAVQDQSWLDTLPPWLTPLAAPVLAAVAAYLKSETNPAPSSFKN